MVLLSFSVKEQELRNETKTRTTRLYTEAKWRLWRQTVGSVPSVFGPNNLQGWWKPRTREGYRIFVRRGADLYRLQFQYLNGHYWPFRERDSGLFTPMTTDEFRQYIREEGFEGQADEFLQFFQDHYAPLEGTVFQSIAFPGQSPVYPRTVA